MSVITVLVEPSSQQTTDGFQKLEFVLPRTWHTKGVKRKCGKLQLKYGSLSEGSQAIGGAGRKEILSPLPFSAPVPISANSVKSATFEIFKSTVYSLLFFLSVLMIPNGGTESSPIRCEWLTKSDPIPILRMVFSVLWRWLTILETKMKGQLLSLLSWSCLHCRSTSVCRSTRSAGRKRLTAGC